MAREFLKDKYQSNNRMIDSIEWDIATSFISKQTYATRKTMTKYSHQWMLSNSKTIDNQIICPYCHQSEENFNHDHFLTCNDSEERKEARIQSFRQLLTQLQTSIALPSTLIKGLKTAYREHHQSNSQIPPTQQDLIGWNQIIHGRISKELANTMTNFYQTLIQTGEQRFTGIRWTKAVVKFILKTHVYEWKYRCELNFQPKSIIHDNQHMSFHKRFLLITVDHFLTCNESDERKEVRIKSFQQLLT